MSLYIDIKKTFRDFELQVQLEGGDEVIALLGESGCGKSLTLKCIAGIEKPDSGRIVINGKTVFDAKNRVNMPPQRRKVGFLFQNYALFPNMSVWNNICCVIKEPKEQRDRIAADIIKAFKLESIKNLYPRQISGGQQQRTALARILVSSPELLMLDEPFSALDSHLKWAMEQEITSILDSFLGATIFVSHDRNEAYRLSDKIAVMNKGKIELIGDKEKLFKSPGTLTAARITGCKNISRAEKRGDFLISALDWGIELQTDRQVPESIEYIGVRAHHFEISQNEGGDNCFLCHTQRVIDEPFEKAILFTVSKNAARLRVEISKDMFNAAKTFYANIPKDKIMFLQNPDN